MAATQARRHRCPGTVGTADGNPPARGKKRAWVSKKGGTTGGPGVVKVPLKLTRRREAEAEGKGKLTVEKKKRGNSGARTAARGWPVPSFAKENESSESRWLQTVRPEVKK